MDRGQSETVPCMPIVAFGKSPLVEAIFELRFQAAVPSAGDLLPGLLYAQLREDYPKVQPLPMATVPRELRAKDPNLLYQPTHELGGTSRVVRIGDRVLSLTCMAPYPGWTHFKGAIVRLLQTAAATRVMSDPERFSFRYINVIPPTKEDQPRLSFLNIKIESPNYTLVETGFHLRFEHHDGPFTTIVQVSPDVTAKSAAGQPVSGLLVDLDTIRTNPPRTFWDDDEELEEAHSRTKTAFLSLVSQPTIARLEPIY